jgi:putative ABC transport system permease protein
MLKDFFLISFRNLRKRKLRSWLTMLGIFIGIAAVVSLISLGEGLRDAIGTQFADLGTDKLVIQAKGVGFAPPGSNVAKKLTDKDFDAIKNIAGIEAIAKRLLRDAKLEYEDDIAFSYAASIPQDESRKVVIDVLDAEMESGRMLKKEDKYKIIVGNDFAHENIFEENVKAGDEILINNIEFEVAGVIEKKGSFTTDQAILMNEDVMIDLFDTGDEIDIIAIQVSDEDEIPRIVEDIEEELRKTRNVEEGKEDFEVQTPEDILETLNTIVGIVSMVLIGIAAISLLVGGIGIMNTMYTSVLERTREIGIMKAIGARNSTIFSLFLIESGVLGMAGGIIGIIIGLVLAKIVEIAGSGFLGEGILSVSFPLWLILGSLAFSFFVGTISGVLPAVQASRLKPVEALRFRK